MLYNIDPIPSRRGNGPAGAIRKGNFKLIRGDPGRPDGWIRPEDVRDVDSTEYFENLTECQFDQDDPKILLYNLKEDPYEKRDISKKYPKTAKRLSSLLDEYRASMKTPNIADDDPRGSPGNYEGVWSSGWCQALPWH